MEWWEVVKMEKNVVILIAVIALVIFAGVQAIQINDLKETISTGTTGYSQANVQNTQPVVTQQAPSMVGGC